MNNTTTKRNLSIVAVFMAATLVVGTFATTPAAFAAKNNNNKSGNTITIQKCKQLASESGFDNTEEQECANLICTHPGNNATCSQEGAVAAAAPKKLTCEQCFTSILNQTQITKTVFFLDATSLADLCELLKGKLQSDGVTEKIFRNELDESGVNEATATRLIACLREAGIVFAP